MHQSARPGSLIILRLTEDRCSYTAPRGTTDVIPLDWIESDMFRETVCPIFYVIEPRFCFLLCESMQPLALLREPAMYMPQEGRGTMNKSIKLVAPVTY
jgi:hypothetical protein